MSVAARIGQADYDRMARAIARSGLRGRIIADLKNCRLEFIMGDEGESAPSRNPWDDEDEAA